MKSLVTVTLALVALAFSSFSCATRSSAKALCSQAKTDLLDRLRAVDVCDKVERQGRVNEAKTCRDALTNVPIPFKWDKTLQPLPDSACPAIGRVSGNDPVSPAARCWSGTGAGRCAWAVCNVGHYWAWSNCEGHGVVYID
jgi:hypothetical protein